ncbi:HEC/Ndc80p family [Nesidiocoris tenuis]|uniref:Kinetochore protein NDC80 n=1 Tax=Nesidiocoris tenuis TaxID=355587 RepID=A0ABN7AN76_9HEMI|nr:HEC/Ndc80p family [Nesidiocoris tenuis]
MKKSSLGRRNSNRPSTQGQQFNDISRRSGIPLPTSRSRSAERIPVRANSTVAAISSLSSWDLMTPMRSQTSTARTPGTDRRSGRPLSSMGGAQRKDNRLLHDKDWQANAYEAIEDILRQLPMGPEVVGNGLREMTQTKFIAACNLLLRQLGYPTEITKPNYLTELPILLNKKYGYKGKMEKSWMIAVGISSATPYVLGALHFLASKVCTLMRVDFENVMFPESFDGVESERNFKVLIPYFEKSWKLLGAEGVDSEARQDLLDKEVMRELMCGFEDYEMRRDQIMAERLQLERFQDRLDQEISDIVKIEKELRRKCEAAQNQIDEIDKTLAAAAAEGDNLEAEVVTLKQSISEIKTAGMSLKERHASLAKKVRELMPNHKNLEDFEKKNESIDMEMTSAVDYTKGFQEIVYDLDIKIVQLKTQIEQQVREFNLKLMNFAVKDNRMEIFTLKSKQNVVDCEAEKEEVFKRLMAELTAKNAQLEVEIEADKFEETKHKAMLDDQNQMVSAAIKQLADKYESAAVKIDLPDLAKDLPAHEREMQLLRHLLNEELLSDTAGKVEEKKTLLAKKEKQLEIARKVMDAQLEKIVEDYAAYVRDAYKRQEEAGIPVPRLDL